MGKIKLEQNTKLENDRRQANEITRTGEHKLEDAALSRSALDRIKAVDDDDTQAIEAAQRDAGSIAKHIARSEVREPGDKTARSLEKTGETCTDYGNTELDNSRTAREMSGDFGDTGGRLGASLLESGKEFLDIARRSEQAGDKLKADFERIAKALEGAF